VTNIYKSLTKFF